MKSYTQGELDKLVKLNDLDCFTQSQIINFVTEANEIIVKSGEGKDEINKAVADEIRTFTPVEVWNTDFTGHIRKSISFIRPSQVEFDDPIEKSKGGVYKDTPENRKMGRVGQKFGGNKEEMDENHRDEKDADEYRKTKEYSDSKDARQKDLDEYNAKKKKQDDEDAEAEKEKEYADKYKPKDIQKSEEDMPDISKSENEAKIGKVMKEFKEGTLKSSSGEPVTDRKQAIAIAISEAKKSK